MKRIYSIVMFVAAAAMAFSSCQKNETFEPETSQEEMVLTFASEKPALDETKTEWTGETIQWSTGDKIAIAYTVAGNWQNESGDADNNAKLYKSEALAESTEKAQFNVSTYFTGTTVGAHVFYGVYPAPSSTAFSNAPVVTLDIPSTQIPGAASFDGDADLMTGVSVGEFTSRPAEGETISMKWTRLVAHANITLKALNGVTEGETISTITLTAQEGANLVGSQKVNLLTNEVENNNTAPNVVTINGGKLTISEAGDVEFWACFLPATLTSLKVEVETNRATYTREIDLSANQKTFAKNARNVLSIKMDSATRVPKAEDTSDYSGTYAIVAEHSSKFYYLTNVDNGASTKRLNADTEMTSLPESGVKLDASLVWNIVKNDDGTYLIQSAENDLYLDHTSGNSSVLVENAEDAVALTIEETEGKYAISYVDSESETRNFVKNSSNPYFAFYTSQQCGPVYFVPAEISLTPAIIVADENLTQSVAADATELSFNYQVKNITGTPTVIVASEPVPTMTGVSATAADGVVTVKFDANTAETAKSATITLSYEGATPVNVVINQAAKGSAEWVSTAFADLKAGNQVVIVATKDSDSWAMSNENGTSSAPSAVTITYSGNKLTSDPADKLVWYVGGDASGRIFYADAANGEKWLYCTSKNDGVRVGTNEANTFVLDATSGYLKHDGTSRYLGVYTTKPDWRCYTNTTGNTANQTFQFFVKSGDSSGEEGGETPVVPVQLTMSDITCSTQTENSLTFEWEAVTNASKYEVTFNNGTAEEVTTTSYTATGLDASTLYTISVKAVGDGTNYTTSEAKIQTGTTTAASSGGEGGETQSITETLTVGTNGDCTWSNGEKTASATVNSVNFIALGDGGNDSKYYSSDNTWRFYTQNTSGVQVEVPSSCSITEVVITVDKGVPSTPDGCNMSSASKVYTFTVSSSVTTLSFYKNTSDNLEIKSISVTYNN